MDSPELPPLEATVAKLTARAPDKLYLTDTPARRQRLEAELVRQLATLENDDYQDDADTYLDEHLFQSEGGEEIVVTEAYPRNAGMASGFRQALKALHLPSGATVYYASGEWESNLIRAVSVRAMDDEAAAAFGEVIALPTHFYAGGGLLELDRHLTACTPGSWLFGELLDREAEWMEQEILDEGEERRDALQRAIDESREDGDADDDQLDQAQDTLDATPPWFLLLAHSELEHIAHYALTEASHTPRPGRRYLPWTKPIPQMFLQPDDARNCQHIVAAYLLAR